MLFLFCTFLALSTTLISETLGEKTAKQVVTEVSKKCASQFKVSPEQMGIAFNQNLPSDEKEKCYLECVYQGVGVVHDGKFNHEGSMKLVALRFKIAKEAEAATQLIETCGKKIVKKEGENCSLGRIIRECFVHHGKEIDFFPSA